MKSYKTKIIDLTDGYKQFKIPIYQRTYDWTTKQCNQLWDDIIKAGTSEKKEHFLGTIVYREDGTRGAGEIKKFLIVDGQQRITSVVLLVVALVRHVGEDPDNSLSNKIQDIMSQLIINDKKKDDYLHKLILTKNDRETLANIIDGKDPPNDGSSRIIDIFAFFKKKIQEMKNHETVIDGISKLTFIDIILEQDDDPQQIFESINSTGSKLTQTDLIRNFVFMGMDSDQQDRIYRDYWAPMENNLRHMADKEHLDKFVRDYLTIKLEEIPGETKVYGKFKDHIDNNDMEDVVKEMAELSELYKHLLFPVEEGPEETREMVVNINRLKSVVAYPFMLRIYSDLKVGIIKMADVIEIFQMIENYVFRRWMCSLPSNALNKIFAKLSHEDLKDEDYAKMISLLLTEMSGTGSFPNDEKFKSSFSIKEAYKSQTNLKYMLERLESHGYDGNSRIVIDKSITIEHIMPKTLSKEWISELGDDWEAIHKEYLDTVGNLTILSSESNPAIGNASFLNKRDGPGGYKSSRFILNAELCKLENWTKNEILDRARSLSERAVEIWKYPAVDQDMLAKYRAEKRKNPDDDDDEQSGEIWEQRFENVSDRVRDRINHVVTLIEKKFDCITGGKNRWLYACTSEPTTSRTAFAVIACGVDTARMTFRINPDTFVDDGNVSKRKHWFFSKGGERSIRLLETSDEKLAEYLEHSYNATKTYLDKR